MSMRVIPPIAIWDGMFVSNVLEDEHDDWDIGTPYTTGERKQHLHWIFEAVQDHTGQEPVAGEDTDYWLVDTATNPYRMFEPFQGGYTARVGTIDVTVTPDDVVTGLMFEGLQALTLQVIGTSASDGEVFNSTLALDSSVGEGNWFDSFFEYPSFRKKAVFLDIPPYSDMTIQIIADNGSEEARIGNVVMGYVTDLGITEFGYEVGILSFSRKERNPFGRPILKKGLSSQTTSVNVELATPAFEGVRQTLVDLDAVPAAYIGSENREELIAFAVFNDFRIVAGNSAKSRCALDLEEITTQ